MKKQAMALLLSVVLPAVLLVGCQSGASSSQPAQPAAANSQVVQENSVQDAAEVQEVLEEAASEPELEPEEEPIVETELTFGDSLVFDGFEITFGTEVFWDTVSNRYSDHNGADVFYVEVSLQNLTNETHRLNRFYFTQFGTSGSKLDGVSSYFKNDIDSAGDIRADGVYNGYMYFLYDGDGEYVVEFEKRGEDTVEVVLPVTK